MRLRSLFFFAVVLAAVLYIFWPVATAEQGAGPAVAVVSGQSGPSRLETFPADEAPPLSELPEEAVVEALGGFEEWSRRYIAATPEERAALVEEGVRLAAARRPVFKQLIQDDPRRAIEQAVPMVVRQQLPALVLAALEKRVNTRATVSVYQGVPAEGVEPPPPGKTLTYRIAQIPDEGAYNLHVYGRRAESVLNVPNAAINGVGLDREIAANESPLRILEVGEVPDPAKASVTVCPVSGKDTLAAEDAAKPITAAQQDSVIETPEENIYLCGPYHATYVQAQLVEGEGSTSGPTLLTGVLPAAPTPAIGMCRVLYIPMTFQDQNRVPATESKCYEVMRNVADYYLKSSFGKLTTLTTVTPPIKLPKNEAWYVQRDTSNGGDIDGLGIEMAHAREEARKLGFDYNDFDVTVLRLSGGARPTGGWGGGSNVWIYSDGVGVTAHEIGHSFGLSHANFWNTSGTSAIGPGANSEYGDSYDVMGGGGVPKDHYNAAAKVQVKWLPGSYVQNITASGLYRIYAFDQPSLDPRNRYALTITKDSLRTYWGEVRQNYNGDTGRPWADKGMILGWKYPSGSGGNIQLIDTTPGSPYIKDDAAIALGSTFSDNQADIHITTIGVSSTTPKYVDVVVNMGDFAGNHAPTLNLITSSDFVPTSGTVTFTANANDEDGDVLAYQWQHWGDTALKLVSPNSPIITRSFPTAGTYVVSCTASDMKGGSITRTKLITVGNGGGKFTISGRVTAGGSGLSNVLLNANGLNPVVTDADGYYTIANLAANTYTVTPLLYGYTFSELFNNSITVGPNSEGANFEATALSRISLIALDASATEDAAGETGTFRLTRDGDLSQPLDVNVSSLSGTAATGDFTLLPALVSGSGGFSTLQIPAESATLDVLLTPTTDTISEGPETVIYSLGAGAGYTISPGGGTATIVIEDNEVSLPVVSVTATTDTALEGNATRAVFTIRRTGDTAAALTVNYSLSGTATPGADFTALSGSVVLPGGSATAAVEIIPTDDTLVESLESVTLTLNTDPAYFKSPSAGSSAVSIIDDDSNVVTVAATDASAREVDLSAPGAVADTGTFVITRSGDTTLPLTVYYSLAGVTTGVPAIHGVDYEALPGVVLIPAGSKSASVTIIPRWDEFGETDEEVVLQLGAGPTDYKIGDDGIATVIIKDSATSNAPYVELIGLTSAVEGGTAGKFRFSVKGSTAGTISVPFTLGGTATLTADYTVAMPSSPAGSSFTPATVSGVLVISGTGTTVLEITINTVNDVELEDIETVTCMLTPSPAFTSFAGTSSASIWLSDNDHPTVWADSQVGTSALTIDRVTEGATTSPIKFYVSRTGVTTSALNVNFSLLGSATPGADYTVTTSGTLTFNNGTRTGVLTIPAASSGANVTLSISTTNDTIFEGTETIVFHQEPGSYSRTPDATIYLDDNDTSTQKVAFDSIGSTGEESVANVSIPVSLTTPAVGPVTVDYLVDTGARSSSTSTNTKGTLPYWTRVVRSGTNLSAYYSTDGVVWNQVGTTTTVSMSSSSYLAGVVAVSGTTSSTCTAVIDNVSVTDLSVGGTAGAATSVTIGTTTPASSSSEAGGVYTVTAGGTDLAQSGTGGDVGRFLYFPITNSADCTITARVVSITGGSTTVARGGVMIRESTSITSRHMAMTAQRDGTAWQIRRQTTTAATTSLTILRPYWVRLQRAGDIFSAHSSPDGSTWTQTGANQTIPMSADLLAGLAVSAKSDGTLSTALFDNVSLNGVNSPQIVGRTVGYVNAQGSDSFNAGIYTVNGSGAQIGSTNDECHFVAAPVNGDFTLVARVISQSGGATTAQAGVMVRELYNYRARSAYAGLVANAMNEFIYRNSTVTNAFGAGLDFSLASGTLTFGIDEQTKNIPLVIHDDTIPESNEAITLILRNPNGAQLGTTTSFTYVINDNDTAPPLPFASFALAASSAPEATAGTQELLVALSTTATDPVSVNYAVTGGTATLGTDFNLAAGTLVFAPGETIRAISLEVLDDSLIEPNKTVVVTLSGPTGAALSTQNAHTFTILDDDLPVVSIVATDDTASETGPDAGQFTISRTGPTTSSLTVTLTRSGTATSGTDYTAIATPLSLVIPASASSATVNVSPVDDSTNEGTETVILTISANANYTIGAPSSATVSILDNDRSTVTIVATDDTSSETPGNTGQFTITRIGPTSGSLTVNLNRTGTATSTTDYTGVGTTAVIAAGQFSVVITVTPVDDTITEGTEQVTLGINSGSYDIGEENYANVAILDNDIPPTVFVSSPTSNGALIANGNGIIVSATVEDDGTPQPVTVNWTQAGGPGIATFESPAQTTTAVTFSADGVYVLRVTATDTQFTASDQVTVAVGNAIAPADWVALDMTPSTQQRGQNTRIGGSYTLTGMGAGYSAQTNDAAHVMARQVSGDGSIVARITSLGGAAVTPLAGVTIRDSLARGSRRAVLGYTNGTLQLRTRTSVSTTDTAVTQGGITLPVWIKLERNATTNQITGSYAADNAGVPGAWTVIGSPLVISMVDDITQIGFTATGNSAATTDLCAAVFDNVTLTPAPTGSALVTEDFGDATPTASTFDFDGTTYTIGGSGSMDGAGAFYGWQYQGDLMVTAKLTNATSGALNAKSGIMIRESMDNGGYVQLGRIPTGSFNGYIWRTVAAGGAGGVPSFTGKVRWMRLTRQGNSITAFHAPDSGGNPGTWVQLGQSQTIVMSTPVLVGFAVDNAGGTAGVLNTCTFTNLSVVPLNKAPAISLAALSAYPVSPISLDGTVTDDNFPAPVSLTTAWSQVTGPGTVVFGSSALTDTTATLSTQGAYVLRLAANDSSITTFKDFAFTGYTRPFEVWQAQIWAASGGSSDPAASLLLDPDNDGLSNLLEYAFGIDPQSSTGTPVASEVATVGPDKFMRLTLPKNPAATDLTIEVQATSTLGNPASWTSDGLIIEEDSPAVLRVRDFVPVSGGVQRFMRIRVNPAP